MGVDFLNEDNNSPMENSSGRDFLGEDSNSPHADTNFYDKAKSFGKEALNFGRNVLGGNLHAAQSVLQTIPDLGKMMPENMQNPLLYKPGQRPVDNVDVYKVLGTTEQPWNTPAGAEQLLGELSTPGKLWKVGGQAIAKAVSPLTNAFNKINPDETAKAVQAGHDALRSSADSLFNYVANEAEKRGVTKIPIEKNIEDEISPYLPKTRQARALMEQMKDGNYSALRKIQSDLWHYGTSAAKSPLSTEQLKSKEIFDLRDRINESIQKHFEKTGHQDLADLLMQAKSKYKNLMDTYYGDKVPSSIKNLVHEDTRKIPNNIMKVLSEKSKPMNRIREQNPFVEKSVQKNLEKENSMRKLKYLGIPVSFGAGLIAPSAYNSVKNALSQ